MVGDADEIPSAKAIRELRMQWPATEKGTVKLRMIWSYYGFYWRNFAANQISYARLYSREMEIRKANKHGTKISTHNDFIYHQKHGGWHCSWCFHPLEFQTKLNDAVCGDGIRMGDFTWEIDLIKKLITKGIWFGANEPPSIDKVPTKLSRKNVPRYAYLHRNDKYSYLFQPPSSSLLRSNDNNKIIMPYCPCKNKKISTNLKNVLSNLGPIEKGNLLKLQNSWCIAC